MTMRKNFAAAALALAVMAATAGSALAFPAWIGQDTGVKHKPAHISKTVNWVHQGQKVNVVAEHKSWYRIQIPGKDGWVKKGVISKKPLWNTGWGYGGSGASFCVNGKNAQFCISGGY